MSADAGQESAAPPLNLTPDEKRVYGQLFRQADSDAVGVVTGEVAVKFFERTRLESGILGRIWQIADKENRGFLTPAGFGVALRLIGHAQAGREPAAELAPQPGPLPRFDGFAPAAPPAASVGPQPPPSPLQVQTTGGPVRIPPLTPDKVSQFVGLFERQPLQNGSMLPGEQARRIFDKSGLPNDVLSKIWELADTEQRGALVQTEFIIAMHLLTAMKSGALRGLPKVLPAALYEAATLRGSHVAPRQSPSSTGMSAIPRQMSGQAQQRTASPLARSPSAAQNSGTSADGWAVSPADKARFDHMYSDLDKGHKGYITGEDAVPFFSQSGLPEDTLAQIWDLADFNSHGNLTREGFAIAMYLIRQQRGGQAAALPSTLPPNLVPPSMRSRPRPSSTDSPFDPPPAPQLPPPPQKSALDDLFGLDSGPSSPAPSAPVQVPAPTGGSSANDPFAGSAGVPSPGSPGKPPSTQFKPFVPSSSFGRGLQAQHSGDSQGSAARFREQPQPAAAADLLGDNDEASKAISEESTDLANLSHQIGSLSKQMHDTQAKRNASKNELNQTNSQKQNFEQRLAQLRSLYEKEAQDTQALEEQLRHSRNETKKLQGECMTLEGTYRDVQKQHQEVLAALQADQKENANLRERIRAVNGEIAQLKPQIEKLRSEARQQRGLAAINKKQLATTEGERDKLKTEAAELAKAPEQAIRQTSGSSAGGSTPAAVTSPALSTASGNNPFFKRTASTDIMGVVASPPARSMSDKSFEEVFGPSPTATPFKPQTTGTSMASTASASTPPASRSAKSALEPHAPPESRQIGSNALPFVQHRDSLTSSRQVSPPASRAGESGSEVAPPTSGGASTIEKPTTLPGAFPSDEGHKDTPVDPRILGEASNAVPATDASEAAGGETGDVPKHPFGPEDEVKAKADFDSAFAAFTTANKGGQPAAPDAATSSSAFAAHFPPITEFDGEESDSDSDDNGFDDDFAPASTEPKPTEPKQADRETAPPQPKEDAASRTQSALAAEEPATAPKPAETTMEPASSHSTITPPTVHVDTTTHGIFGTAASGTEPSIEHEAAAQTPQKPAVQDLDDDFEGLEDAKEGSADDDFANISRSGLDDFNPVFDSPRFNQSKSDTTAFGNESSFDFVSSNSASDAAPPSSGNQQKAADAHDWDAIFAGLDSPDAPSAAQAPTSNGQDAVGEPKPSNTAGDMARPPAPGRALTEAGQHDDPILKNLTGMGYSRADAVSALEKYDYNLERAADYLASQS